MNGSTRWPYKRQGKVCWNLHTCPCQKFHSIPPDSSSTLCITLFCVVSILIWTQPAVFLDISKLLKQGIFINFISLASKKLQVNYNTQVQMPLSTPYQHTEGTEIQLNSISTELSTLHPSCCTPGKESQYPMNGRLGGPQSRSGWFRRRVNLAPTGIRTPDRLARS